MYYAFFFLAISCKPPTVLSFIGGCVKVMDDKSGGWERIAHVILRYQQGDTLQYLFDNYTTLEDYPREIRSPYVCYMPKEQSGVLGVHVGQSMFLELAGKSILPPSEICDYQNMKTPYLYYLPLYQYQIRGSLIRFHRMTPEERQTDTIQTFSTVYAKVKWLANAVQTIGGKEAEPDVMIIFHQIYDVTYKYLIASDTVLQKRFGLSDCGEDSIVTNVPMIHLPLETDVYYKKNRREYLVKKRMGFCTIEPLVDHIENYHNEIDTALLALPVRIFQEKYLQTKNIYCLDEVSVPVWAIEKK